MWGISKKTLGWYANWQRGELLTPHVELNEDLRYFRKKAKIKLKIKIDSFLQKNYLALILMK